MSRWEAFADHAYFDMWCVRPAGSRKFGQGFHLVHEAAARELARYLTNIDAPDPHVTEKSA